MRRNVLVYIVLLILLAGLVWASCSGNVTCPVHDVSTVYFTGKLKFYEGHTWHLYHCTGGGKKGHDIWIRCD